MTKVLWPNELSEEISPQHSLQAMEYLETTNWNSPEVTSQGRTSEGSTPSDVAVEFMSVYDSLVRFSLESILAALSVLFNGHILVSTCNYSRNRRLLHFRRPSLYTLLFVHLTLVNFLSAPITWMSNNLLLAGRRWSWLLLVQMNFCQFTGTIVALSIVSMVINLAATFIILGFSLVQYIAIRFPLKQLSLLRRRNVRSYLIVCWLGVAVGWTAPIAYIINILSTEPTVQRAVDIVPFNSTTVATIQKSSPSLCHKIQFLKIVQLLTHFSYLSTFLITIVYVSAFGLCMATFMKIRAVSKQMAHCRTKPRSPGRYAKIKIQTNFSRAIGVSVAKVPEIGRRSVCCCSCCCSSNCRSRQDKLKRIGNQANQTSESSDAFKQASTLDLQHFDIQERPVSSNQESGTDISCQIPSASERSGTTNSDRRAFVTIASLGIALTFYLVPSLIIQFLSNGPMEDVIIKNAFLIYFMALLPYTKYLVDPIIYGLRMPEMRSSTWCFCWNKQTRCFSLPRKSLKRSKEQTTANVAKESKLNLKSKDCYSNTDAGETKLAPIIDTSTPKSVQKSLSSEKVDVHPYLSTKIPSTFCQKDQESINYSAITSKKM